MKHEEWMERQWVKREVWMNIINESSVNEETMIEF